MAIERITCRDDLVALKNRLCVGSDWHEPDQWGVTARVHGSQFDNAGAWGAAEVAARLAPDGSAADRERDGALETWVTLYQDGDAVAEVNLATLFAFATGFDGSAA